MATGQVRVVLPIERSKVKDFDTKMPKLFFGSNSIANSLINYKTKCLSPVSLLPSYIMVKVKVKDKDTKCQNRFSVVTLLHTVKHRQQCSNSCGGYWYVCCPSH